MLCDIYHLLFLLFIFSIGHDRLRGLLKHLKEMGLTPKIKKSGGRKSNKRAHNMEDIERAQQFIANFGAINGLLLPGHTPGYRRDGLLLLPSSESKVKIHTSYVQLCKEKGTSIWI